MAEIPSDKMTLAICNPGKDPAVALAPTLPADTLVISADASAHAISRQGVKMDRLTWVDATGKMFWKTAKEKDLPNWFFTEGPDALAHLSALVATKVAKGKIKLVVLCKLNPIIASNGTEKSVEFIKYLIQKLRALKVGFVLIAEEDADVKRLEKKIGGKFGRKIAI